MSFFELFQPGLRFLREEKDRQKMVVAQPKFGKKGGPLGIDLEGGTATFSMPPQPGQDGADAAALEAKPGDPEPGDVEWGAAEPGDAEPGEAKRSKAEPRDAKPGEPEPSAAKPCEPEPSAAKPGQPELSDAGADDQTAAR